MLDAVRAARSLPSTSLTAGSGRAFGYSQGGGATARRPNSSLLRPRRQARRHLRRCPAGRPDRRHHGIDGSELAGALGWSVNGFLQSDPTLKPIAEAHLNAPARRPSPTCRRCASATPSSATATPSAPSGPPTAGRQRHHRREPALQAFLDSQRIGTLKPSGPVRLATGVSDNLVPHRPGARNSPSTGAGKGADVTYKAVVLPDVGSALLNHFAPLLTDQGAAIDWLTDRLSGKRTTSNCWSMPVQP